MKVLQASCGLESASASTQLRKVNSKREVVSVVGTPEGRESDAALQPCVAKRSQMSRSHWLAIVLTSIFSASGGSAWAQASYEAALNTLPQAQGCVSSPVK